MTLIFVLITQFSSFVITINKICDILERSSCVKQKLIWQEVELNVNKNQMKLKNIFILSIN